MGWRPGCSCHGRRTTVPQLCCCRIVQMQHSAVVIAERTFSTIFVFLSPTEKLSFPVEHNSHQHRLDRHHWTFTECAGDLTLPCIHRLVYITCMHNITYSVSQKKIPPTVFWNFFPNGWGFLINFYPRDAMLARVIAIATCLSVCPSVSPSVRLSVRHAPVLCQNEES